MATYEVTIDEDLVELLTEVSEASETSISSILSEYLNDKLADDRVELSVQQYKAGNLTAMKAWKLSGLSFDEFNALAKD